jgi:hypothetical protein
MATAKLDDDRKRDVRVEFGEAVNRTAPQLRRCLDTEVALGRGRGRH